MKSLRPSKTVRLMIALTLLAAGVLLFPTVGDRAYAQPQAPDLVKADVGKVLIDPADTVILLLDHQSGLFQTVKDISVAELRTNTIILAKVATHLESAGRCGVWRPVSSVRSELSSRGGELPESAGSPQAGEEVRASRQAMKIQR